MDKKLRIGFVGVGGMGQAAHLQNYATLEDCEVVALAELRADLGRRVAQRWNVPHVYANHKEMLAAEKLDGIVCVQPFGIHGSLIPEVLAKGVPVITEKPLSSSVAVGEKIVAAEKAGKPGGGKLLVGYHKRSDLASLAAKKQIQQWQAGSEAGKMRLVRVTMPPGDWINSGFWQMLTSKEPYPSIPNDPPEFADESATKKFVSFVNYYIHQVNLIRFLLGENYAVKFADPSGCILAGNSDSGVAVVLEMASFSSTLDWQESALVTFEHGWIRLDLPAPLAVNRPGQLTVFEDFKDQTPRTWSPALPPIHAMRNQAKQFLGSLRGEPTTLCTPADALADLRTARQYIDLLLKSAT